MKRLLSAVGILLLATGVVSGAVDGTNVWVGAATGGSWKDVSNWRAVSSSGYGVADLFHRYAVYDLRGLANGAVLDFDYADGNVYNVRDSTGQMFIAGLVLAGADGDVWTVARNASAAKVRFQSDAVIDVAGGRLDFHPQTSANCDYPTQRWIKRGTGTLRFCQENAFFWEVTSAVEAGTLSLTNNYNLRNCGLAIANGARLAVEFGSNCVAGVSSAASVDPATTRIDIAADATLDLMSGFNVCPKDFYGDVAGTGVLRVSGGCAYQFHKGGKTRPYAFEGLLRIGSGDLAFGSASEPVGVNSAASVSVDAGGWLRLSQAQRIAGLRGGGVDGGVAWPSRTALTVASDRNDIYSGRLRGGAFVKDGAGTLTLDGETSCTDTVNIASGTLALRRGFYRRGLAACWRFEDDDDLGADSAPASAFPLIPKEGNLLAPTLVDDGVSGRALHFGGGQREGGKLTRDYARDVTGVTPVGNAPFTFSFWMRPESGCGLGPNFIHVDKWSNPTTLNWGTGFFFGSVIDGNSRAFKQLGFYTTGWTRDGRKSNTNKVAVATFETPLTDGAWHHVVGTYSNRVMKLYVDGTLRDTVTRPSDLSLPASPVIELGNYSTSDVNHKYAGDLDEIQWLRGAWSAEEVAAEYAARRPTARPADLLPAPTAHWTFDALETDGADRVFRDAGPHGIDLVSVPSNGTHHVTVEPMTYPENLGSRAARTTYLTSHLRVRNGAALAAALPTGRSFTVSLRSGNAANGVFFILGDGTTSGSVRFEHGGCPRVMGVYACSSTSRTFGQGCVASTDRGATWFLSTVVYDADSHMLSLYEDGVLCRVVTGQTLNLKAQDLVLGAGKLANGAVSDFRRNVAFDDLRVWNTALDPHQVQALARAVRAGDAVPRPVLPETASVMVSEGATLRLSEGVHRLQKVSGAVEILGGAELVAFTTNASELAACTFTGAGTLRLAEGTVFTRDGLYRVDTAQLETPGRVILPARAHLRFTNASTTEPPETGVYRLVSAREIVEPASWEGWTCEPVCDGVNVSFSVENGTLLARVNNPDRVWTSLGCRLNIDSLGAYFYPQLYTATWSSHEGKGSETPDGEGVYSFTLIDGADCSFDGRFSYVPTGNNTLTAEWTMTPNTNVTLGALAVSIALPISTFGGGRVVLGANEYALPATQQTSATVASRTVSSLEVYASDGTRRLRIDFHEPHVVLVQDNRSWNGETFSLRIQPTGGTAFTAGTTYTFGYDVTLPENVEYAEKPRWKPIAGYRWIPMPSFAWVKPGTALDFSSLRGTEAPAGRYGRVVRRGRHFEFENLPGVPQRFYGVNICQGANAPAGNEAVFAAGLARIGYNAIRFHHHEAELVKNTGDPGATALNPAQMDRFDRLVAACVTNGLYITTDLFVSRSPIAWRSLGIDRNGSLATADMKALVLVHEPAISNLIVFTRNFLGHVNPYLGRSLAAEPAMVGISLVNEGAISTTPSTLVATYPQWGTAWRAWLAERKATEPSVYGGVSDAVPTSWTAAFRRFVQEREHAFAARMKAVVRDELGCRAPLTNLNGCAYPLAYMEVRASEYDYADDHFYVDHPTFLETSWQLPSSLGNKNPLANSNLGMQSCFARRLFDRPYTLTEYNYSGPGRYRGVGGLATGATGAVQDWDGIWRFAWTHGDFGIVHPEQKTMGYFDVGGDPLALAAERAAICLFLRRDLPALRQAFVARIAPSSVNGPVGDCNQSLAPNWRWAGWYARCGYVVSNAVPTDAIDAGAYPAAGSLTDAQVQTALGLGATRPAGADGALDIDARTGAFRLDTERTAGGFAEAGTVDAGVVSFDLEGSPATVWASSVDGLPLRRSKRILLAHVTDVQNTNITYADDSRTTVLSWGKLPHLMHAGRAQVRLRLGCDRFAVYALAPDGTRRRRVDAVCSPDGVLRVTCDVASAQEATWLYEIIRIDGTALFFR